MIELEKESQDLQDFVLDAAEGNFQHPRDALVDVLSSSEKHLEKKVSKGIIELGLTITSKLKSDS
jgi:aspartate carbamoyltransferase catalytic subunit